MKITMKKSIPARTRLFALNTLSISMLLTINNIQAAPGTPANSPLFLSNKAKPNIFFMIDDSGSMDWADLLNTGAPVTPEGALLSDYAEFYNPPIYDEMWNRLIRRLSCPGFNVLAYDPNITYTPWQGVDSAGNPYTNMSVTNARNNPYQATGGTRTPLALLETSPHSSVAAFAGCDAAVLGEVNVLPNKGSSGPV